MPAYHLRTFYLARQNTWGTPETPNFRLEGVTDGSVTVNINDEVIDTIGWNVGNITMQQLRDSEITVSLVATYEQILYILHGMFGAATVSGSSAPYSFVYKAPFNVLANPQVYTILYGIENDVYLIHDCVVTEMSLSGTVNNALELEVTFVSPNAPTPSTLPSIPVQNVNAVHVRDAEFYLSDINTFPSSTSPVEFTLTSFELSVNPNRHIKRFIGNTNLYGDGKWQIEGSLTLEFNNTSKSVINDVLTNTTRRNLELRFSQPSQNRLLSIVMPFIITDSFDLFSDRDGNATVELNITAVHADLIVSSLRIEAYSDTNTLP